MRLRHIPTRSFWVRPLPVLLLLSLLATLIYSNSFPVSFYFDDIQNIVENPRIKDLSNFLDLSSSRYVGFLTFALNYHFGGLNLFGYHLVNLLIHVTNGFLVYSLVMLLFKASASKTEESAPFIALTTALLFIAHPIQTQAVTYIVQRFASLATLFYLLGVVAYLKWRTGGRLLWYGIALIATVLGMKTKEFLFTLPFMILLVEMVFFTKRRWASLIPFLLTLLIIPFSRLDVLGEKARLFSGTAAISRSDYLFTQLRVIVTYLRLLLFPAQQNLDYDYPIYHSLFAPPVLVSFLFLLTLFVLGVKLIRPAGPKRLMGFGILWFFLTLSAESSIIPIRDVIFEHRLYLPSVGIFLAFCAAWGLSRPKTFRLLSMGVILLLFSFATYQRNRVWQDEVTFWRDVVEKSPHKVRGHNNLGIALGLRGEREEAIREYQTALRLKPDFVEAYNNLGVAYKDQGRLEEAIREYQTALRFQPNYADAHNNLGLAYKDQGRFEEAIREYQAASQLNPNYADAHNNLGVAYKNEGRLEEAIREYQIALRLQPDLVEAHSNLGVAYKNQGRLEEAIREYLAALQLQPENPEVHNNLGVAYKNQGRLEEAIREYLAALRLQPNYVEAHYNLGVVYKKQGRVNEAVASFKHALRIQPDLPLARQALDSLRNLPTR